MATRKKAVKKTVTKVRSAPAGRKRKTGKIGSSAGRGSSAKSSRKDGKHALQCNVERQRKALLALRDRVTGQISFLSDDAGRTDEVPLEDRTDEFDREFALSLVSTEQDALYEIDEALRRIDGGRYGLCESCEGIIESNRLRALPFARNCLGCQADLENGL